MLAPSQTPARSPRRWVNDHPAVVGSVFAGSVAVFAVTMMLSDGGAGPALSDLKTYYYDMNTGELLEGPVDATPPIVTASGPHTMADGRQIPAGARAHVLACGDCSDAASRRIGWIEIADPKTNGAGAATNPATVQRGDAPDGYLQGRVAGAEQDILIRRPNDRHWVPRTSAAGRRIVAEARAPCPGGAPLRPCQPPR